MHVLLGKKQIILAALVAALGLAVFVNWYYTDSNTRLFPEDSVGDTAESVDRQNSAAQYASGSAQSEYFASVRLQRDESHAEALEKMQSIVANAEIGGDAESNAAKAIEELSMAIKTESDIESLVTGKIGCECVAVISDNSIDVVVPSDLLTDTNVLTISDVINEVCSGKYENIKISAAA